jgi:hypothetical protein
MKTYEAIFEPDKNKGVYGISLVENPAMEGHFIALSKEEKIQFKTIDEEKRILVGLVLEPNKPIYRNQDGEEFNIVFSEKTVEDLCYGFTKNQNNKNSTIEHNENQRIEGVTFVENWLVRDEKMDTTLALGIECKKGSWATVMKVDNDDVWNDYVKSGKVKGFSIDALVSLREVNFKSELNMSENVLVKFLEELPSKIALALNPKKETEIELGEIQSEDGKVSFMFEGDTMQVGGRIWVVAEDGTEVPLPVGDYVLEDTSILVVAEEGVIAEVKPKSEEAPMENKPAEMTSEQVSEATTAIENAIKSIMIKYSEDNKLVIDELRAELKETKEQLVSLSEQPASKPIKSVPTQVDLSSMTPVQRFRFLKEQN